MKHLDPLYGEYEFDGVFRDLIQHDAVQRLKHVSMHGAGSLVVPELATPRYDHALGVAILVREYGSGEREQLAGLLHDVFTPSFAGALTLLGRDLAGAREELLGDGIGAVLADHGFDPDTVFDTEPFGVLTRAPPDIGADQLDHVCRDLVALEELEREDIRDLVAGLRVIDGRLVADSVDAANELLDASIAHAEQVRFRPELEAARVAMADLLDRALEEDIIEEQDLFARDDTVLEAIEDSRLADDLTAINPSMDVVNGGRRVPRHLTMVDPPVQDPYTRLSDIDPSAGDRLDGFQEETADEAGYGTPF
ncbi:MAG: hypothetical protein SV186_03185 [Candidatus Nanohaloarchaea archaeon]|nr:hypothetical protein [Candidatus Nanohaloarchaea archaeon]